MKFFGIRQTRRNFNILVVTTAVGRAGAAQSCPVSRDLNYEFQNREEVVLYAHSTARLVFSYPDLERGVYIHLLHCFLSSCKLYSLGFIQAYVLVKKKKKRTKIKNLTNFVIYC